MNMAKVSHVFPGQVSNEYTIKFLRRSSQILNFSR